MLLSNVMFDEKELRAVMSRKLGTTSSSGGFEILDAVAQPLGRGGGGFMSEQLKMYVTVKLEEEEDGTTNPRQYEFFVKVVPTTGKYRKEFALSSGTYDREQQFYQDLAESVFLHSSSSKGVIPRHFLARRDALVMEDLSDQGFKMVDARGFLDFDHMALTMEYLARFHAATLGEGVERAEGWHDLMVAPFHEKSWFPAGFKTMARFLELMPKYRTDAALRRKVLETLPAVYQRTAEQVRPSKDTLNVVCHGDLWSNNILFHYGADGEGKPDDLRFMDFQWARYAPPATDIMMFLHLSTDREFRRLHEGELLDLYHRSLTSALHGDVISRERFLRSCEEVRLMGQTTAAAYCSLVFMDAEYSSRFLYDEADCQRFCHEERYEEARHCFLTDVIYRERVTEVMEDFVDNCVLTFS